MIIARITAGFFHITPLVMAQKPFGDPDNRCLSDIAA
jgi:hypothetical protein